MQRRVDDRMSVGIANMFTLTKVITGSFNPLCAHKKCTKMSTLKFH